MKKFCLTKSLFLLIFILTSGFWSSVSAQSQIDVKAASIYINTIGNYSAEIQTPEISGMTDTDTQQALNNNFKKHAQELIAVFAHEAESMQKQYPIDGPHFHIEYKFNTVYNNANHLVFSVYEFTAAGSSNYSAQYFTVDKQRGVLMTLEEMTGGSRNYMKQIENYIYKQMREHNKTEEMKFWIDDDAMGQNWKSNMDLVFSLIEPNRQYFLNENGNLVIAFNKYDVAPGAMGSPQFEIPIDEFRKN